MLGEGMLFFTHNALTCQLHLQIAQKLSQEKEKRSISEKDVTEIWY